MNRLIVPALAVVILASCYRAPVAKDDQLLAAAQASPQVEEATAVVARGDVTLQTRFLGTVEPVDEKMLFFRVDGRIRVLRVKEGDRVRAGQVLAELEMSDLEDQIAQATVALEKTRARVDASQQRSRDLQEAQIKEQIAELTLQQAQTEDPSAEVAIAKAALDKADLAVADAKLANQIQQKRDSAQAVQRAQLDEQVAAQSYQLALQAQQSHQYQLKILEQQVELARVAVDRLKDPADPAAAADVSIAELTVNQLQDRAAMYRIVAPTDGQVLSLTKAAGDEASAFQTVAIVADPSRLEVSASLMADQVIRLHVGQVVSLQLGEAGGQKVPGRIRRIPFASQGSSSPAEADQTTRISFAAPPVEDLKPGDPVRITVVLDQRKDVLYIPKSAARSFRDRTFAVVVDGENRRRVLLQIGLEGDDDVEVMSGLQEGQRVVLQ
ncbi:MAG TPA: HlyD family efflux transporter periplasmic adaptor subunit [Spirochaetia bacterium]|nr:HlyD family efflux transporter periplasmic adaptor subunit [Spirochaetia bacterium]